MRPYFFRQSNPAERRIEGFRSRQRVAEMSKKKKPSITSVVKSFVRSLVPKRLTEMDRWYLQRAEEKRARRRARNLRWWAADQGWHKELAG